MDLMELLSWSKNLLRLVDQTLLRLLVSEVDRVNSTLPRVGVADCSEGSEEGGNPATSVQLFALLTNNSSISGDGVHRPDLHAEEVLGVGQYGGHVQV